jgi:hypothetical protein
MAQNIIGKLMNKIPGNLGSLKDRQESLASQRDAAKITLDKANAARQSHLLEGDANDTKTSDALRDKVIAAESNLAGLDDAFAEQTRRVAAAEAALDKEQKAAARKSASEAIGADVAVIKEEFSPWLASTRKLATDLEKLGSFRFEAGSLGRYFTNASNEVEAALSVIIPDLERGVINVLEGTEAAPAGPVPAPAPAPQPAPVTRVFSLKDIAWRDTSGAIKTASKYLDVDLPPPTAMKALKLDVCCMLDDPRRKKFKNSFAANPRPPLPASCIDLDGDQSPQSDPRATEPPPLHTAFQPLNRGGPRAISIPAAASRNQPKGE